MRRCTSRPEPAAPKSVYRLLVLSAHDPNDMAHGMGLVVNNTLRELTSIEGVEVSVGLLNTEACPALRPRLTYRFDEQQAAVVARRHYSARSERFRCGLRMLPAKGGAVFLEQVRALSSTVDGVLWFGYYWDSVSQRLPEASHAPVVFHVNDSLSLAEETRTRARILRSLRAHWARWQERMILNCGYAAAVYCSREDAAHVKALVNHSATPMVVGLENGVDTAAFSPPELARRQRDRSVCLFAGRLDYPPNIAAARYLVHDVLPPLDPNVDLYIAGANPTGEVVDLCASTRRAHLLANVPDMAEVYRSADVFVAPMAGRGGIKNKILEAAACGLPVVTTVDGASGLGELLPGMTVVRSAGDMAVAVGRICAMTGDERRRVSADTVRAVHDRFSWAARTRQLLSVIRTCTAA